MITPRFHFGFASHEDEELILNLQREAFPHTKSKFTHEWYDWLFRYCPLGASRTYIVADEEVAGSNSFRPIHLRFNHEERIASFSHSTNTREKYRGQGLFTKLIKDYAASREHLLGVPISVAQPNANSYRGFIKAGYVPVCELSELVKRSFKKQKHICTRINEFDWNIDRLVKLNRNNFKFTTIKDHHFLNWRFSMPGEDYTIYVLHPKHWITAGYIVLKKHTSNGVRKAHIVDMQAETEKNCKELLKAAEIYAYRCDELTWNSNEFDYYRQWFLDEGYEARDTHGSLVVKFNDGVERELQKGNIYWSYADNDVY